MTMDNRDPVRAAFEKLHGPSVLGRSEAREFAWTEFKAGWQARAAISTPAPAPSSDDLTERYGPQALQPFVRVGWVRSDEEGNYQNIISEQAQAASEYGHGDYDTPVFTLLYSEQELREAQKRAHSLAEALRSDQQETRQETR